MGTRLSLWRRNEMRMSVCGSSDSVINIAYFLRGKTDCIDIGYGIDDIPMFCYYACTLSWDSVRFLNTAIYEAERIVYNI